ncbi:glutathione S-transferase family protein [Massilia sp. TS11]|uniref:glutathione S-transferase family protein n=1 Tax=Massilia sp. TS11 TaxID=2908003 RepID=UPI001EDB647C|nr:glutathione S-transferase family protein [Massilia sp. TS11]MCG2584013.1 glutathione S-transferase family protein [Massilia sp. TS11]
MKLYTAPYAPNPRRVTMFIAEKGLTGIESVNVDLMTGGHRAPDFLTKNPFGRVPALELEDGRVLCETRAICTYLEGLAPEPNLMGQDATERAFIEMADRRVEWHIHLPIVNWVRHTHPALAAMEQPQFGEYGATQGEKLRDGLAWLEAELAAQPWIAGARFTIADITAFCALEFARGMVKFKPGEAGFSNVQAWRDRVAARPSVGRP